MLIRRGLVHHVSICRVRDRWTVLCVELGGRMRGLRRLREQNMLRSRFFQ